MQKNNNILNSIIAANVARTGSVQITEPTAASYIKAGEVVATSTDGTILTATSAATATEIVLVQGQGAGLPLIKSAVIKKANVTKVAASAYVAPTEQVSYFGYNGTGGNIDAINSNEYVLRVTLQEDTKTFGDKMNTVISDFISDSSTSSSEVAFGLTSNILRSVANWADVPFKAEVITAGGSLTSSTQAVSVVNGSKTITYAGTPAVGLTIGSLVFLAGATYLVTNLVGAVATLNLPFQGATNAALAAGTTYASTNGYLGGNPTNVGIKITGIERRFRAGVWKYYKVRFVVTAKNGGSSIITNSVAARKGIGYGKEVQEIEWETVGNEGAFLRTPAPGSPVPYLRLNSKEASSYGIYNIQFFDQNGTGVVAAPVPSYKQLIIAAENATFASGTYSGTITDATNGLSAVLAAFTGTAIA